MNRTEPSTTTLPASRPSVDRYARWTGLAVGALAGIALAPLDGGDGVLYAIPAFGLCAVAGVLAGDALTPRARGAVRTAGLAPRRVRDYVPPRMTAFLLALAGALVLLLAVAGAIASPDDLGRASRSLTVHCAQAADTGGMRPLSQSAGPWPGLHYGLPILGSLAVATAACGWSLRRIATRPGDERSRRDRSLAVVAAWGLIVSASLLGAASTASGALMNLTCDGTAGTLANWVLWPLAAAALVTVPWTLVTVCSPVSSRARHPVGTGHSRRTQRPAPGARP
ncbi:hypothetical protein GCM10018980_10860 [Streptomyces capoamus]|uniref:Uncharacterized protein n=1 Tax=Streptomyces capoamus TaxID=68183 RepID=A0A919EU09_9ACTN|nr:hypothetical protein [Streptomyces capoamus]GGW16904.1 hypothetical protein GCM10010501_35040 [Streptomyces libani subsp. rufus]GHG38285.1 hypothetical protein GCM10018980_10860 [Streptomyces capoamus]